MANRRVESQNLHSHVTDTFYDSLLNGKLAKITAKVYLRRVIQWGGREPHHDRGVQSEETRLTYG